MTFLDDDEVLDEGKPLSQVFSVFRKHNMTDEEISTVWNGIVQWVQNGDQNQKGHARSEKAPREEDELDID